MHKGVEGVGDAAATLVRHQVDALRQGPLCCCKSGVGGVSLGVEGCVEGVTSGVEGVPLGFEGVSLGV
jgi:hypothetical protein